MLRDYIKSWKDEFAYLLHQYGRHILLAGVSTIGLAINLPLFDAGYAKAVQARDTLKSECEIAIVYHQLKERMGTQKIKRAIPEKLESLLKKYETPVPFYCSYLASEESVLAMVEETLSKARQEEN